LKVKIINLKKNKTKLEKFLLSKIHSLFSSQMNEYY